MFGDIFQRWQERRAKAKADKAALAKRVQVFVDETKPLIPKSRSSHTQALLYRHAWRRAFAIASLYEAKGQIDKYEEYRTMALELSNKYNAVAPETLYGKVKLSPGGEAFERILQFELQRFFPEELPVSQSRPLACIYIGTCDQGRIYIGQTVGAPELRWAQHRMVNSGPLKDGEKYVTWAVLEKEVRPSNLNERESYYIGFYDADRSGYNETSGNDWAAYQRGQADRATSRDKSPTIITRKKPPANQFSGAVTRGLEAIRTPQAFPRGPFLSSEEHQAAAEQALCGAVADSLTYGSWDGEPFAWAPGEAWAFRDGAWTRVNSGSVGNEGRVLFKSDFDKLYPSLPGLPKAAFQSSARPAKPTELWNLAHAVANRLAIEEAGGRPHDESVARKLVDALSGGALHNESGRIVDQAMALAREQRELAEKKRELDEKETWNLFIECCDRGDYEEALQLTLFLPDQTSAFVEKLLEELGLRASPEPRDIFSSEDDVEEYFNEEWPTRLDEAWKVVAVLRSAAKRGHPVAQQVLGDALTRSHSPWAHDADASAEGVKWMREAAEKGRKDSQETLGFIYAGTLYTDRNLVPRNYAAALTWLGKAAAQNCSMRAQFTLGQLYYEGQGTVRDYGEANRWFRKVATSRADPEYRVWAIDAQVKLAGMCYKGEGVPRDRAQAFMWVTIALKQYPFAEGAEELRNQIIMELTPMEIVEAEQRAKTWLESHAS